MTNPLGAFVRFVEELNMGISAQEAAQSPRSTYRKLAILLHPDTTKLADKEQAEDLFAALASLYGELPPENRNAACWYGTVKTAIAWGPSQKPVEPAKDNTQQQWNNLGTGLRYEILCQIGIDPKLAHSMASRSAFEGLSEDVKCHIRAYLNMKPR